MSDDYRDRFLTWCSMVGEHRAFDAVYRFDEYEKRIKELAAEAAQQKLLETEGHVDN